MLYRSLLDKDRDFKAEIRDLKDEIGQVQQRIGQLRPKVQDIQSHCQQWINEIQRSRKQEIQLTSQKRELSHPASSHNAITSALETKVKSISTYANVDLEVERARVLATYGAK